MDTILRFIIIGAAIAGFWIASAIGHKKRKKKKFFCLLHGDCEAVVRSRHSAFFTFPVEVLGLWYYGLVAISYSIFLVRPDLAGGLSTFAVLGMSAAAFLFSLYLTGVQLLTLRQWCTWCLASAGLSALIFWCALATSHSSFIPFLAAQSDFLNLLHFLALAIGLGGSMIYDILFLSFVKNLSISESEEEGLHALSQIIWASLAVAVMSSAGIILPLGVSAAGEAANLFKIILLSVIVISGVVLHLFVAPHLIRLASGTRHEKMTARLHFWRRQAVLLNAVSMVSWLFAFGITVFSLAPFTLIALYLDLLIVALLFSRMRAHAWTRHSQ